MSCYRSGKRSPARSYYLGADYEESVTADELYDHEPQGDINTGLVDANGRPIYRVRDAVKFGFVP